MSRGSPAPTETFAPPPRWLAARDNAAANPSQDSAFFAGAALSHIDQIMRSDPPWIGAWRQRQALAAAAATVRLLRGREDEAALRDLEHLTKPHHDPGPAGRMHRAWRWLSAHKRAVDAATIARLAAALDLAIDAPTIATEIDGIRRSDLTPIAVAASVAQHVGATFDSRAGDGLALMLADLALADWFGWSACLPLLATTGQRPLLGRSADGPAWPTTCGNAYALAALGAHRLALNLARRARRFEDLSAKVRTKGRDTGVAAILMDDAVVPTALTCLGSDRAARRFLDRLAQLGAVRELSGRSVSRIYGL